ncbi:MAG: SRPBCC domain-containing protein [Pseudomonadota bacterium]
MTVRTVEHGTIRLERRYEAAPSRVFAAWAEPAARAKWDVPGRWVITEQTFDFREGGRERKRFGPRDDPRFLAETLYLDIVSDRRIVFSYVLTVRNTRISASLTTVELAPEGRDTKLLLVEQVALFDGNDTAARREEGLSSMLDKIGESLAGTPEVGAG